MTSNEEYEQKWFWEHGKIEKVDGVFYAIPAEQFQKAIEDYVKEKEFNLKTGKFEDKGK